jgi:hypothetical protein
VAISPDVVSFVHRYFGYCNLFGCSGIRNVAGEASSVSLATGTAPRNVGCCTAAPEMMEAPDPSTLSGGGFCHYAASVAGHKLQPGLPDPPVPFRRYGEFGQSATRVDAWRDPSQ